MSLMTTRDVSFDIAAIGYPAVRQAFDEVLNACAGKLTKREIEWACEILELDGTVADDQTELLMDTALYSVARDQFFRPKGKRAVDRLAKALSFKRDALKTYLLRILPDAFFSIFEFDRRHPDGGILVKDLLDKGRPLHVMDGGLAISGQPGDLLALRLLDVGPWHVGFGIVLALRRSEAAAIMLASAPPDDEPRRSRCLHELVYTARIHDQDLVSLAIEPIVLALSIAIDTSDEPLSSLVENWQSTVAEAFDR